MMEVEVLQGFPCVRSFKFVKDFFQVNLEDLSESWPLIILKGEMYSCTMIALYEDPLL